MKIKNALYYVIKALNIAMTSLAFLFCLAVGYIFFCNVVKMPVPTLGPFKLYVVLSDSMAPYMKTNDGIIVKKTNAEKLKVGDVITFLSFESNTTVTHRISKIAKTGNTYEFNTWGDNNNVEDTFITPEEKIIGKVVVKIDSFGFIIQSIQKSPILIAFPVFIYIVIQFILSYLQEKLKPLKKEKSKKICKNKGTSRRVPRYEVNEQGEVERSDFL